MIVVTMKGEDGCKASGPVPGMWGPPKGSVHLIANLSWVTP